MQNLNQSLSEATFFEQTGKMKSALTELLIAKGGRMKPTSWAEVQRMVRDGTAAKIFSIGDQLTCQRDGVNLVWDVIGIDHDTPADPRFTHSMTLQLHDCFPTTMQFDAPEALYYCETALEAGTYHFTVSDTDYQFETENDIVAGSQLILVFSNNIPTGISVSAAKGGAVSGNVITVTAGSGGTALHSDHLNEIGRVQDGSNNYKESAIRQWLGSSAAAGAVWTPQTDFDRPPTWAGDTAGFLNGMDADFLAVVGEVTKVTAKNTYCDGGGFDTTSEKFFLLSKSEVYGDREIANLDEGAVYPYYANYSDLAAAGIENDSNRIKYRNNSAQLWLLRTPTSNTPHLIRSVRLMGDVGNAVVRYGFGVAAACCII